MGSNHRPMADKDLAEAERLLDKYVEESKCGWCRKNGRKIRDATKELRSASPAALSITEEFTKRVGKTTALDGLDDQKKELSEASERNRNFTARLNEVLDGPREKVQQRRPFGPSGKRTTAPRPQERGPSPMPMLPRFTTPDEVGQKREEQMERFRAENNRRTGPLREKIRFRIWDKRLNGQ